MAKRIKYQFTSAYLSKYDEIKVIGEGGNSTVYKVTDEEGNEFALKLLNKKIDKESIKRFKNEIGYCSKANHENIMKVIDNGVFELNNEKLMFYVMPLYDANLRDLMLEGISNDQKLNYFNQILEGIKYFHNSKNYHRDIKPENILFDKSTNTLVVADLGISHFNKDDLYTIVETKVGSRMANFQYAAPEQKEKGATVDHRADIYALGLILNELFTGHVPYGSSYKKIGDVAPEYSFLDDVVELMIKQNKDDRPNDIETVQFEINSRIELDKTNKEIKRLKEIKIKEAEEKDILILDPPKLIDVKYDEYDGRLRFKLSQPVNKLWVDSIKTNSWTSLMGYDVDNFRFEYEYASVQLPVRSLDYAQTIINHFKQWINNANSEYPKKVKQLRDQERRRKEAEIKAEIQRKEKIANTINNLKF